jgi:HEPN domain-containing protein
MSPKEELVREWLKLADDDLSIAEVIMQTESPVFWAIAFHCQQAAEKSLKAFLAYNEFHVKKTPDIEFLIKLSTQFQPEAEQFMAAGAILTDYAIDSRYPAPKFEITRDKADEAIEIARNIFEYILKALPDLTNNGENKTK